jgi:hypothetical protein
VAEDTGITRGDMAVSRLAAPGIMARRVIPGTALATAGSGVSARSPWQAQAGARTCGMSARPGLSSTLSQSGSQGVSAVAFSPGGATLAAPCANDTTYLWHV